MALMAELSDAALVEACRQGNEAAWEVLVNRFRRLVFTIPRRAGLDAEQSADVFQRVFELLVGRLDELEQPERVGAWLATAAKHETWRIGRRQATVKARTAAPDREGVELEVRDTDPLPEQTLVHAEEQALVRASVDRLDDRCRQLLDLLFYRAEPLPYAQVAVEVGIAEGSIGPIRARCLERLKRLLDEADF